MFVDEDEVTQLCQILCDPVDYSLPGFSVRGFLQARILEWVAIAFSRDLPDPGIEPRSPALEADTLTSEPLGKPIFLGRGHNSTENTGLSIFLLHSGIAF